MDTERNPSSDAGLRDPHDESLGMREDDSSSTTGATANRHSPGASGLGQSSGRGPDAVRDPDRLAGSEPTSPDRDFGVTEGRPSGVGQPFVTSDPAMADQPAEGGEDEVDQ